MKKNPLILFISVPLLVLSCSKKSGRGKVSQPKGSASFRELLAVEEDGLDALSGLVSPSDGQEPDASPSEPNNAPAEEDPNDYSALLDYLESNEWMDKPYEEERTGDDVDFSIEHVETRLLDSCSRLRFLEYGNEVFVPQKIGAQTVLVRNEGKQYLRSFYDDRYRLTRCETWRIDGIKDFELVSEDLYFFDGESTRPSRRELTGGELKSVFLYDENGLVTTLSSYQGSLLQKVLEWRYTADGKITEEKEESYAYNEGIFVNKTSKKQIFIYNKEDESVPPDYEFYEDGILKIRTEYSSKSSYVTQLFFDASYSVRSYYEDNVRKKDYYLTDGVVRRTKEYE